MPFIEGTTFNIAGPTMFDTNLDAPRLLCLEA
jgi:hypothetical protein